MTNIKHGNVEFTEDYSLGVSPVAIIETDAKNVGRPVTTIDKENKNKKILQWGDDNAFPQAVIKDVRKNPELGRLLNKQINLLYSSGLEWGSPTKDEKGKKYLKPVDENLDKEIRQWCKRTAINRYLVEAATDLYYFNNVFVELVLSNDRTKIAQVCVQAAEECRWGPQNGKGLIDKCFINAQWEESNENDPLTKELPVLDPYYNAAGNLREIGKGQNFIYPINFPTPGNKFYQLAEWNAIRESGWLDVSADLPKLKKALLKNQSTIKYHIKIASRYWEEKYKGEWEKFSQKQKNEKKAEEITAIQSLISGAEKAGKNIWSTFYADFNTGKEIDLIKIEAIDDKLKDGKFLEDGKDASIYTMSAVGLHPALVGTIPNNGLAGAGSNIREAYNLHILTSKPHQDLVLEPLNNVVADYNGWEDVEFALSYQFMTTLDAGKETAANPHKLQIPPNNVI